MKMMKFGTQALTALTAAGMLFAAGCGETEGESCLMDPDCGAGTVCVDQVCTPTCMTEADCLADEECVQRPSSNDTTMICQLAPVTNNPINNPMDNCTDQADQNQFCIDELADPEAFCNSATGMCEVPAAGPVYTTVQLSDISTDPNSCDSSTLTLEDGTDVDDAGSDFLFVELLDSGGATIGWGEQVDIQIEGGTSLTSPNHINGQPPTGIASGGLRCPENQDNRPKSDQIVSVGCGGSLAVRFLNSENNVINLETGQQIVVGEYGAFCPTGMAGDVGTDMYQVLLCTDAQNLATSCSVQLATGAQGLTTTLVTLPTSGQ